MKKFLIRLFLHIGDTSFEYKGSIYRTTGFFFVHTFPGGEQVMSGVSKWKATHVIGSGVCGGIFSLDEIDNISNLPHSFHRPHDLDGWKRITWNKLPYEKVVNIPTEMTKSEWDEQWIDELLK